MLIIVGIKTSLRLLGMVTVACPRCHNPAAHRVEDRRRQLTLFFLPLLPLGHKTYLTCTYCGFSSEVAHQELAGLLAQAHDGPGHDVAAGQSGNRPRPEIR